MKKYINNKYLNKDILISISNNFKNSKPISYFVFDDFLNENLYRKVEKEFSEYRSFNKVDSRNNSFISNKSILINNPYFLDVYNFFISSDFEIFLQLIYKVPLKKYKKITSDFLKEKTGIENSGVVQIFEKGDFMGWHTDISKDMKRKELVNGENYTDWDKCIVYNFDEVGAFIYYIYNSSDDWKEKNGGVLELGEFSNGDIKPFKKIFPKRNRLVLIKSSNYSYHRVTEIKDKNSYRITIQDLLFNKNANIGGEKMS